MRLPEVTLDDRRFQELVDEARQRIVVSCPEWTDHNVSDPGITLVELFAWMTDMLVYRVNRIPEKVHVALLDVLGLTLAPPAAATTELRFRLTAPTDDAVVIRGMDTEVATLRGPGEEPVVFRVLDDFSIPPLRPSAYAVERAGALKDVGLAAGVARPTGRDREPFGSPPVVGDALYLGFDQPLDRLLVRVDVECSPARGAGVTPEDPPLAWEVSTGDPGEGGWARADVLLDTTGGFNYGTGVVELQLPPRSGRAPVAGHRCFWIRCRVDERTRSGHDTTGFTHPPLVDVLTAAAVGALVPATHAARVGAEPLGTSDGTAGQTFALRHHPLLDPEPAERVEVLDPGEPAWQPWTRVESFAASEADDRHYTLDPAAGRVELGPAIRQSDGSWRRFGAIPPKGGRLRMSSYRHGGGRQGNVAPGTLTVLRSGIPGVDTVTNPAAAVGGVDAGSLGELRERAPMELRARYRAVTREDFEHLACAASPRIARAICVPPDAGGAVRVHVVPRVEPADRPLAWEELIPDGALLARVAAYLDERRLIGTSIDLLPAKYRGITVVVNVQAEASALRTRVEQDVAHALYTYLNPLVGGTLGELGSGWPFGRALNQGELYGVAHSVPGVEHVKLVRVFETDLRTGEQQPQAAGTHVAIEPDETIASVAHIVRADPGRR